MILFLFFSDKGETTKSKKEAETEQESKEDDEGEVQEEREPEKVQEDIQQCHQQQQQRKGKEEEEDEKDEEEEEDEKDEEEEEEAEHNEQELEGKRQEAAELGEEEEASAGAEATASKNPFSRAGTPVREEEVDIEDPLDCPRGLANTLEDACRQCFIDNWQQIRTRQRGGRFVMVYTRRLKEGSDVGAMIQRIFRQQKTAFKVNLAFGFILRNGDNGEVRYYYPSRNGFVFPEPFVVANPDDLQSVLLRVGEKDWQEYVRQQKPSSKWRVAHLTNVSFHVYPLVDRPIGRGGEGYLPRWVVENRGLDALEKNTKGKVYGDNLCYFRCLARFKGEKLPKLEKLTKTLAKQYFSTLKNPEKFSGIHLKDLASLDELFDIHTFVYSLKENGNVELVHRPVGILNLDESNKSMKLNLYGSHFSYVKDMDKFSKCYVCSKCNASFPKPFKLERHEKSCEARVKHIYTGGIYHPSKTIFEKIADKGIEVAEDLKFSKYRATFDIEVYHQKDTNLPERREKLEFKAQHRLLSISVASNVPDFKEPKCFVVGGEGEAEARKTVEQFINYLEDVAQEAKRLEMGRYANLLTNIGGYEGPMEDQYPRRENEEFDLDDVSEEENEGETKEYPSFNEDESDAEREREDFLQVLQQQGQTKKVRKLIASLEDHLAELTVVGFNSGKYDLNVLKDVLIPLLVQKKGIKLVIKRHRDYLALKTGSLKFIDISNFIAGDCSYAQFLEAYNCDNAKGFFPHDWMDSLKKLENPSLPPQADFYSWLHNRSITEKEYRVCQEAWKEYGMSTVRDFLKWYNNLDVVPFLEALEKMTQFWRPKGIDMFKEAISLSGLAFKFELSFLRRQGVCLSTFHTKELYQLFKDNNVGGPAIIFHRYAEFDKTKIREHIYGEAAKPVRKIVGYDANALYLWALCQPMPVGLYTTWNPGRGGFTPSKSWREADEWLAWIGHQRRVTLQTRLNDGEKRLGYRQLPVDGYDPSSKIVYEFHGCFWHGCCTCYKPHEVNTKWGKKNCELLENTNERVQYLKGLPDVLKVVQIWECEWLDQKSGPEKDEIESFLNAHFFGRGQQALSEDQLLQRVKEESFFGCVVVDIETPDILKQKFSEMTPVFRNVDISRKDIGDHMRQFAEENDVMATPRRALVGIYGGEKILLSTPLLKFYLEEGLVVKRVYQAVQWTSCPWLRPFGEFVSNSRRDADEDPSKKILGETAKLVGNAGFGRFIMDATRHQQVKYEKDEAKVARAINSMFFRDLEELSDGVFELKSAKRRIKMDLPIQIGFFVFQYAKLKMLKFYYRLVDTYLDRQDYQYLQMDTDSAYIALSGESIDALVKPDLREKYLSNRHLWFPREDSQEHAAFDKRTPGLFKVEWSGEGFVGLNSKTYYCWGTEGDKASSKGISKKINKPTKDKYLEVLKTKQSQSGENRGFKFVKNKVYTYAQHREGFSYFYPKRKVEDDGVTTVPLDI